MPVSCFGWSSGCSLPGAVLSVATGELAYLGVAVAMLGTAMGVLLAEHDSVPGIGFRWMGPAVVSVLGLATLAGSLSGLTGLVSDWLDRDRSPRELAQEVEDAGVDRITSEQIEQALFASDGLTLPETVALTELTAIGAGAEVLEAVSVSLRNKGPVIVVGTPPGGQWLAVGLASAVVLTVAAVVTLWVRLVGEQRAIPVPHDGEPAPADEDVVPVEDGAAVADRGVGPPVQGGWRRRRARPTWWSPPSPASSCSASSPGLGWLLRHQIPLTNGRTRRFRRVGHGSPPPRDGW